VLLLPKKKKKKKKKKNFKMHHGRDQENFLVKQSKGMVE
jgi:hypothetical protein